MEDTSLTPTITESEPPAARPILLWAIGLVVTFALGLAVGYMVWARPLESRLTTLENQMAAAAAEDAAAQSQAATQAAAGEVPQKVQRYPVPIDDDPIYGKTDAPITIIEFSDYECPFCRRWHQEVWPQIQEKYGDQVRLVYRDFPLYSIHPNASPAAEAANCAGEQDRYWEFNELLFANENLGPEIYTQYAKDISLDINAFQNCLDEQRYLKEVEGDYQYASELGVRSTPTFFINGLAVVGAQPFEVFQRIIDMELAGEIPE